MSEIQQTINEIKEKLDELVHVLMGNPAKPNELSFLVRVDRLEQSNRYKNRILWVLCTGVLAVLVQLTLPLIK